MYGKSRNIDRICVVYYGLLWFYDLQFLRLAYIGIYWHRKGIFALDPWWFRKPVPKNIKAEEWSSSHIGHLWAPQLWWRILGLPINPPTWGTHIYLKRTIIWKIDLIFTPKRSGSINGLILKWIWLIWWKIPIYNGWFGGTTMTLETSKNAMFSDPLDFSLGWVDELPTVGAPVISKSGVWCWGSAIERVFDGKSG